MGQNQVMEGVAEAGIESSWGWSPNWLTVLALKKFLFGGKAAFCAQIALVIDILGRGV